MFLQGVQLRQVFDEMLKQTQEVHPELEVVVVQKAEAPVKRAALDILFEHLRDGGRTPADVFGIEEDNPPKWMNKIAFNEMLEVFTNPDACTRSRESISYFSVSSPFAGC